MNYLSIKSIAVVVGVLVMAFSISYIVLAVWQEPTASPPDDNVPAPINVGDISQYKTGVIGASIPVGQGLDSTFGLTVGGNAAKGIKVTGYSYFEGDLEIQDTKGITLGGDYKTAWPTGTTYSAGTHLSLDGTTFNVADDWYNSASNVISGFGGCSGTMYLGADGACHTDLTGLTSESDTLQSVSDRDNVTSEIIGVSTPGLDTDYGLTVGGNAAKGIKVTGYSYFEGDLEIQDTKGITLGGDYKTAWPSGGDSDWIISGDDMYSGVSGNVGIGTSGPGAKLDVVGNSHFFGELTAGRTKYQSAHVQYHGAQYTPRCVCDTDPLTYDCPESFFGPLGNVCYDWTKFAVYYSMKYTSTQNDNFLIVKSDGNVGIGTDTPDASHKLTVAGGSMRSQGAYFEGKVEVGTSGTKQELCLNDDGTGSNCILDWLDSDLWKKRTDNDNIYYNDGNVGIGTDTPQAKLDVDGDTKMREGVDFDSSKASCRALGIHAKEDTSYCWRVTHGNPCSCGNCPVGCWDDVDRCNDAVCKCNLDVTAGEPMTKRCDSYWLSSCPYVPSDNCVENVKEFGGLIAHGNVGIGTTNPQAKLDVNGAIKIGVKTDNRNKTTDGFACTDIHIAGDCDESKRGTMKIWENHCSDGTIRDGFCYCGQYGAPGVYKWICLISCP